MRAGGEACDDANVLSDDGCSDSCAVEAGFVCKPAAAGGKDVCTASIAPPAGSVFISASIRLETAMTAEQLVGPVRRSFRQAVAESTEPKLSIDKVLILSVRAGETRRAGVLAVNFRMEVAEAHMQTVMQSLSDAVESGTLTTRLQEAGLDVTVKDMSEFAFVKSDGSSGAMQVSSNAGPARNWIFAVVVAGIGGGLCALCCCLYSRLLCAGKHRKNKVNADAYAALVKESMKDWTESLSHSRDSRIIEGSKHAGSLSLLDDARVSYFPNPHADRTGVQRGFEASKERERGAQQCRQRVCLTQVSFSRMGTSRCKLLSARSPSQLCRKQQRCSSKS